MNPSIPESERLLMSANLHRLRGELNEAEATVRLALLREPTDLFAQEFLGDLLTQKGEVQAAEEVYRAVLRADPTRGKVEDKLARLVLKSTPVPTYGTAGAALRSDRKPYTVAVLSLVFPGAGQYYLGDKVKGILFSGIAALMLFAMVPAFMSVVKPISSAYSSALSGDSTGGTLAIPSMSGLAQGAILLSLFTLLQVVAAIDGYRTARGVYRR